MSLRLRQAALLAGMLIAGLAFGAPGVRGQAPVPTVPPTPPGPPPGIAAPLGRLPETPSLLPLAEPVPAAPSLISSTNAPSISTGFDGIGMEADSDGFIHTPPDTHAAVGPSSIVEITNGHVAIFNKSGGLIAGGDTGAGAVDLDAFCGNEGCFDPKVIYDHVSQRFVAVAIEGRQFSTSFLHVMVSTDSTPGNLTTDWDKFRHAASANISGPGWFDYPGLGVSPDALVVTGNIFSNAGSFLGTKIRVFDKVELYDGDATATFVDINSPFAGNGHTFMPAHHFGSPPAGTFYLLQNWNSTFVRVTALTGVPASPVASSAFVGTSDQGVCVGGAPQQGTTKLLDTLCQGMRMMSSVWRDGSLWGTLTGSDSTDVRTVVQWFEIETNGYPSSSPTLRQHGALDGGTGEFTFMPSISVDSCGNAALTYTQSSSSRFPEMRYTGRLAADALNTLQTPSVAKASAFFFDDFWGLPNKSFERWGDYSATVIDPIDQSFWVAHEYAKVAATGGGNNGRWGTWIANFTFGCTPVDIDLTTDGSVAFGTVALSATVDSTGDVETISVVTGPANLFIKSTAFTDGGASTWTLGTANGTEQVVWEFSTDGSSWTPFTAADTLFTLANAVAEGATQDIFFRLTMPTTTLSSNPHNATVTLVAVAP